MIKTLGLIIFTIFLHQFSLATELMDGKEFSSRMAKGYQIQAEDTLAGYPIYAVDGDWTIIRGELNRWADVKGRTILRPFVGMERVVNGQWAMSHWLGVNAEQGQWRRIDAEPCRGEKIVKIDQLRGILDRCATAEMSTIRVAGESVDVLKLNFTEVNVGRIYQSTFYVHPNQVGYKPAVMVDKSSDFNKKLEAWMNEYLKAMVKAANDDKMPDAFKGMRSISQTFSIK